MSASNAKRDILVGLVILVTGVGFVSLLALASGGGSYLASNQAIDVYFRDGQGLREGSPVRIAGIDAGRVEHIDLVEHEGILQARVRVALPVHLAKRLKQDVKMTIQPSLTGQSRLNIVSSGRSTVALVPGQPVQGVESSFFDPILEQAGLGPVERNHLSHMIAEIRTTIDSATPRIRQILGSLQGTADGIRESTESIRPAIEEATDQLREIATKLNASTPKIENTLSRVESLTGQVDTLLTENRANLQATLATLRDLTATTQDVLEKNRPRAEQLLVNLDGTRLRADRLLYQADIIAGQGVQMVTKNRADMERTVGNVKDATDWANKLVQKLYANPFVLSPFYKPTPEDTRVQVVYDTAQVFTKGAQELHDMMKTLEAMQARASTPQQQQELQVLRRNMLAVTERLGQTSQLLAEGLRGPASVPRVRR